MMHTLKIHPEYFILVSQGVKTFEIRNNDRGFKVGDRLMLEEFDPTRDEKTGRFIHRTICYMTTFGLQKGYVALGIQ